MKIVRKKGEIILFIILFLNNVFANWTWVNGLHFSQRRRTHFMEQTSAALFFVFSLSDDGGGGRKGSRRKMAKQSSPRRLAGLNPPGARFHFGETELDAALFPFDQESRERPLRRRRRQWNLSPFLQESLDVSPILTEVTYSRTKSIPTLVEILLRNNHLKLFSSLPNIAS